MSFILDALKKSENARQRQAGPALFEVRVTPPRRGLPIWAIVIGILLLTNGTVLTWMLLRRPAAPTGPVPAIVPATVRPAAGPAAASATPPASVEPRVLTPVSVAPTSPAGPGAVSGRPATASAAPASMAPAEPAAPPPGSPAAGDLAPALQPPPAAAAAAGLPLYAQIAAGPGTQLPALHMDLHVYDPVPSKRFVMINMHKLRQGDSLTDGVTVVQIRPDGVVLSYQGRKFLMPR
ncbi:MAG: general secretion pathway protein GspB [Steroidobacteraceae bacterium]